MIFLWGLRDERSLLLCYMTFCLWLHFLNVSLLQIIKKKEMTDVIISKGRKIKWKWSIGHDSHAICLWLLTSKISLNCNSWNMISRQLTIITFLLTSRMIHLFLVCFFINNPDDYELAYPHKQKQSLHCRGTDLCVSQSLLTVERVVFCCAEGW